MRHTVTIAIALYNNESVVDKCIESVLSQTYSNLDILIVDDGSTDNSIQIIKRYNDKRIRIHSKKNGGLSSVRQYALANSNTDYICFIDADDYIKPTYIEKLLNKIIVSSADICVCSTLFLDQDNNILKTKTNQFMCTDSASAIRLKTAMLEANTCPLNLTLSDSWNKMYRTQFIRDTQVCFMLPKGFNGTDSAFNQKLALHEPLYATISDLEYVHIMYKSSAVHRKDRKLFEGFLVIMQQIIDEIYKLDKLDQLKRYVSVSYAQSLRAGIFDLLSDGKSIKETYQSISCKHEEFTIKNRIIDFNVLVQPTTSQRLFVFLYKYLPFALGGYYKIVNHIVKNRG